MKFEPKRDLRRFIIVTAAAILFAINVKTFVRIGGLYPGGVAGLSIILQRLFDRFFNMQVPYTVFTVILNSIPVFIGFKFIGKKFTILSVYMIILSSVLTDLLPTIVITYDTILISLFGGILSGIAMSLCLRADATSGGTDFIAIFFSQRKGIDTFNYMLIYNIILLAVAGFVFGWDKALYSIVYQYTSTQVIHLMYRNFQQQTLFIVTNRADEVSKAIYAITNHGATIMTAEGSYRHDKREVVY
ncbi:MAG: YitT family protein, partial [Lachnospiraceae bacterium]|nr:YitT family protein [Lachnospiraceae bacterium]